MKYTSVLSALLLTVLVGCATIQTPVTTTFPDVPKELLESCQELAKLDAATESKLSSVAKKVVFNYNMYYQCSTKNDAWIEWYNTQRQINRDLNNQLSK
jgi:hypothetical protein